MNYVKKEYPKFVYNEKGSCLVKSAAELKALGKGYVDSPAKVSVNAKKAHVLDEAVKVAKAVEAKKKEDAKGLKELEKEAKDARALANKEKKEAVAADKVADIAEEAVEQAEEVKPLFN